MKSPNPAPNALSIAAVERETGLSKDTLRAWERRYNFPTPDRDAYGERSYPPHQVEKLRLMKKLMAQGRRPGKLAGLDEAALRDLAAGTAEREAQSDGAAIQETRHDLLDYVGLCKAHQVEALRTQLMQRLLKLGMYRFVTEVIAPLNALVGEQWAAGELAVFEEHLYTEAVQVVMRNAIAAIPRASGHAETPPAPRIVLTTIPHESHGLGLLMAEAILALEGAHCVSLGVQTPVAEIAQAARAQQADIVALSFSSSSRATVVLEALADLRAALPDDIEIWAGGRSDAFQRRHPACVTYLDLSGIPVALEHWRARAAASPPGKRSFPA